MAAITPLLPPRLTRISLGEGRFVRLRAEIARGSLATVHRGDFETSFGLRRAVAVKVFDDLAFGDSGPESVLSALLRSARRLAALRHPNIVRIEDFGFLGPVRPYVVGELVEGMTLDGLARSLAARGERMPLDLALFVGGEIAGALVGASLATSVEGAPLDIVHGGLCASQVLLSSQGEVKVSDFGVAAAVRPFAPPGRPAFGRRLGALAPEVVQGRAADARSDVFSLGVVLREMLLGPRFPPAVGHEQALALAREGAVPRGLFEPHLDAALATVLQRALERDPARRYPNAGALGYELRRIGLAMGVGDGRSFLRSTLARVADPVTSDSRSASPGSDAPPAVERTPDRFARLRGDPPPDAPADPFER